MLTALDKAETIANLINSSDTIYRAKTWDKRTGEARVYVSYSSRKGKKECGYIRVMADGTVYRHLTLQSGTIEALYESAKAMEISRPDEQAHSHASVIIEEPLHVGEVVYRNGRYWTVIGTQTAYFDEDGIEVSEQDCAEVSSARTFSTLAPTALSKVAANYVSGQDVAPEIVLDAYNSGYISQAEAMNSDF